MAKYYCFYNTGAGDFEFEGSLEGAMKEADEGCAYTQESFGIKDESGNTVAKRQWYGVEADDDVPDDGTCIFFGQFGYYGPWTLLDERGWPM